MTFGILRLRCCRCGRGPTAHLAFLGLALGDAAAFAGGFGDLTPGELAPTFVPAGSGIEGPASLLRRTLGLSSFAAAGGAKPLLETPAASDVGVFAPSSADVGVITPRSRAGTPKRDAVSSVKTNMLFDAAAERSADVAMATQPQGI